MDAEALDVLDSEPFQRLRYVRQLGHAFLVYPGATHSRFEHALGTYHLARRALALLAERGELRGLPDTDITLVRLAALLHDVGHYPFSHALEEIGLPSHETLARERFRHAELAAALRRTGIPDVESQLATLIRGASPSPLQGLISGSLDLDKIEYLTRDARMCGVPYGTVDVDRLLHSITLVEGEGGTREVGVHEKGVAALESLLFAKYQMFRNVYWHHAVRSATAMFKRLVRGAVAGGALDAGWIPHSSDEALMEALRQLEDSALAVRLLRRRLYKRAVDLPASEIPPGAGSWIAANPDLTAQVEDRLAGELGLSAGELLLDFPSKPAMLDVDLPLRTRSGRIEWLGTEHGAGRIGLPRIAEELHTNARRLRLYVATPVTIDVRTVLGLAERSAEDLEAEIEAGRELLASSR